MVGFAGAEPRRRGHGPAPQDARLRPHEAHQREGRAPPPLLPRRAAAARPARARARARAPRDTRGCGHTMIQRHALTIFLKSATISDLIRDPAGLKSVFFVNS